MTCEGNKKGCNNKILINTWMLVSMVCILSVSDMWGGCTPPQFIDPDEAMEKIKGNPKYYKEFMKIFKDREDLIKRNCCCCGGIDIEHTNLPTPEGNGNESSCALIFYIKYRFTLNEEGGAEIDKDWLSTMRTCKAFDSIILEIYNKPPAS